MNTQGFGGRALSKTATVTTNDKNQSSVQLTVKGSVEEFAAITPARVVLNGDANDKLQATVTIVPRAKYPFKIVGSRAQKGQDISFVLKEDVSGSEPGYLLTVTNLKTEPGSYHDTLYLETDSQAKPQIEVKINGNISKLQIASVNPQQIILRGRSSDDLGVSAQIVPKDGYDFKITEATADNGWDIRFTLTEAKEGGNSIYTVAVTNQRKMRGRYRDIIRLKTTSEIQPEIEIPVLGIIN